MRENEREREKAPTHTHTNTHTHTHTYTLTLTHLHLHIHTYTSPLRRLSSPLSPLFFFFFFFSCRGLVSAPCVRGMLCGVGGSSLSAHLCRFWRLDTIHPIVCQRPHYVTFDADMSIPMHILWFEGTWIISDGLSSSVDGTFKLFVYAYARSHCHEPYDVPPGAWIVRTHVVPDAWRSAPGFAIHFPSTQDILSCIQQLDVLCHAHASGVGPYSVLPPHVS